MAGLSAPSGPPAAEPRWAGLPATGTARLPSDDRRDDDRPDGKGRRVVAATTMGPARPAMPREASVGGPSPFDGVVRRGSPGARPLWLLVGSDGVGGIPRRLLATGSDRPGPVPAPGWTPVSDRASSPTRPSWCR